MLRGKTNRAARQAEALWTSGTLTGLSDAQLMSRFAQGRDAVSERAFGELVNRHGPMVLGVCREILSHSHDADDAFQATFLVLVRKAHSICTGESLAPWLYSVAYRTAQRTRAIAWRHRPRAEELTDDVEASTEERHELDLAHLLYEELARLPVKYRAPIVLCHLEGKTHEEAARVLSWPVGTVSGRLSRGRQLLRSRLERRGITVPAAALAFPLLLGSQSFSMTPLVERTLKSAARVAAAESVSASVLSLTQGVLKVMLLRKIGSIAAAIVVLGALSGGVVAWAHRTSTPPRQHSHATVLAAVSSQTPSSVAAKPSASPDAQSGSVANSSSASTLDCPADCPMAPCDEAPTYCPIAMAKSALTRMLGY
jgi:RNA polymerase sigma factor (sigma-70 family)